ncbi:MAG TPA: DUF4331 family protein [Longimicrobiaceae bacterium]
MRKSIQLSGVLVAAALTAVACDRETPTATRQSDAPAAFDSTFATNPNRFFVQVERLGNPLVAEVFLEKREHETHNIFAPRRDAGHFTDDITFFTTTVGGRSAAYANTLAGALVGGSGDELRVFTDRAAGVTASTAAGAATVGWLSHALAPNNTGYGGRKLAGDDVVDKGLGAIFGTALGDTTRVTPGLVTDNVGSNDKTPVSTFPYLPEPTP